MIITRFHNTETIDLEAQFLTPAFLGGADQQAELRSAPFKSAMRFWWRALNGGLAADELRSREASLFGSSLNLDASASIVRLVVCGTIKTRLSGFPNGEKIPVTSKGRTFPINILDYLAYGKHEYIKGEGLVYRHSHIPEGVKFSMSISFPKNIRDQLLPVLRALFMFGGVGSRSRNGFGSLSSNMPIMMELPEFVPLNSPRKYSTLSKKSTAFETKTGFASWEDAQSALGILYRDARTSLEPRHQFEKRGLIARPIEVRSENIPEHIRRHRHPKPFFMSVKKKEKLYFGRIVSMPIDFYENGRQAEYDEQVKKMQVVFSKGMRSMTESGFPAQGV